MKLYSLKYFFVIILAIALTMVISITISKNVSAHLPPESSIYFQQQLRDPITNRIQRDPVKIRFAIYPNEHSIEPVWEEIYDGNDSHCQLINPDKYGNVSVQLGQCVDFPNLYADIKKNGGAFFLGVSINDEEELQPRLKVGDLFLTSESFLNNRNVLGASTSNKEKGKFEDSSLLGGGSWSNKTSTNTNLISNFILGSTTSSNSENENVQPPVVIDQNIDQFDNDGETVEGNFQSTLPVNFLDLLESAELRVLNTRELNVRSAATFEGTVSIKGDVTFNSDTVGQAKIYRGDSEVRVIYSSEYKYPPIVTVTPIGAISQGEYFLDNSDKTGFTIKLNSRAGQDYMFNWHAFASDREKVFASAGFIDPLSNPDCKGYSWVRGFSQNHDGVDLSVDSGCPVNSIAAGVVTYADFEETSGFSVRIDHGNGIISHYYHGDGTFWVKKGDLVTAGQTIMMMGQSGNATGIHLHLQIFVDGVLADPAEYVPFKR